MGESRFDPAAGTLTLGTSGIVALAQAAGGTEALSARARSELATGGLLQEADLHPRLVPIARALARPLVRLRLDQVSGGSSCDGWFDPALAVLITRSRAGEAPGTVAALPRALVPATIARAVGLGPRSRPKVVDPAEMDAGLVEALLASGEGFDEDQVEGLVDPADDLDPAWIEVLAMLSAGIRARWRVGVWWNSSTEQPEARFLEIVDSDSGLFLITMRPRGARGTRRFELRPLSSTQVWRLLCALVPPLDQVSEPLNS